MKTAGTICKTAYILYFLRIVFTKTPPYLQKSQKLIY